MIFSSRFVFNLSSSPLLGLQNFSMPCLIRTMRDSSVKDSITLKLHSGLTSKKVMPFFSAYALACSVGTCRLKARCRRLPTRIRGTPGACCQGKINHRTELTLIADGRIMIQELQGQYQLNIGEKYQDF